MTCHIVTEGQSDAEVVKALLRPESEQCPGKLRVWAAGGWSAADSLARTVLVTRAEPVALLVDAGTVDESRVAERMAFLEASLRQVGGERGWQVLVAVPEVEGLLFQDRGTLERLIGKQVTEAQMLRGRYEPTRVLRELTGGKSAAEALQSASDLDLSALREVPWVRELRSFLERAGNGSTAH